MLRRIGDDTFISDIEDAFAGSDEACLSFLTSNELWGGAGSIADQAGSAGTRNEARILIEEILIRLGEKQLQAGIVNSRTSMWVEAFKSWRQNGI